MNRRGFLGGLLALAAAPALAKVADPEPAIQWVDHTLPMEEYDCFPRWVGVDYGAGDETLMTVRVGMIFSGRRYGKSSMTEAAMEEMIEKALRAVDEAARVGEFDRLMVISPSIHTMLKEAHDSRKDQRNRHPGVWRAGPWRTTPSHPRPARVSQALRERLGLDGPDQRASGNGDGAAAQVRGLHQRAWARLRRSWWPMAGPRPLA